MDKSVDNFNVRLRTIRIRDLIIGLIITSVICGILMVIFPSIYDSDELFMIVFIVIMELFFVYCLLGTKGLKNDFKNLFEDSINKDIIYVLILNLQFAFLFVFLISLADLLIGFSDPTWISMWDIDSVDIDSGILILDSIASIFLAPVIEALIFRGVLFNRLKIRTGIIPAMIISSLLFAVGHDFGGITSAFIFGICMCILYLKTDNILVPMSIHFLNNVSAEVINLFGIDIFLAQFPWLIPSLIITIIGTVYLIRYILKESKIVKKEFG